MGTKIVKEKLKELLLDGHTLQECADLFGCTREYIRQYRNKYLPDVNKKNSGARIRHLQRAEERLKNFKEKHGRDVWHLSHLERAQMDAFHRKRQNTKHTGKEFSVTPADIVRPTHCPVLGVELDWFSDYTVENSPSFDRVDSTKGYVPGNVVIISWRANRIKNNGTSEEHYKIADWLKARGL